uniref:Uncharacterized protein n=1 Tax=Anguilla anguilla TaxID=7936 RepID=A0A0E9RY07_ANGAN
MQDLNPLSASCLLVLYNTVELCCE